MAKAALQEDGRAHFLIKRFDRTDDGEKIHMATLCALDHADYKLERPKPAQS